MNAETIKDFLVSLGFQVDEAGSRKFEATLVGVTSQAVKMGAAIEGAALSVVAFTAKISSGLDSLYWASQRTGATVAGIQQIGYAVSQMGGTAEGAKSSLESLSRFMRNNPGAEGFLNRLGVQTRDAKGNMRDMASVFTGVGDKLRSMPYYRANQYAQMLGIDENTLMAMRRGVGQFSAQYSEMAKAIGYNADTAAVSSNKFMTSLRSFGQMAGMARDKIGSNLAEGLAGSLDNLRKQVLDNFPKIEDALTRGIKGILWLAEVIGQVVYRLIQSGSDIMKWWDSLDKSTQGLIKTFGLLLSAWKLLDLAFRASPIGRIAMLALGLFALYDDYKAWKEGGKSLIDWGQWKDEIEWAKNGIGELVDSIKEMATQAEKLFGIDPKEWSLKWEFTDLNKNLHDFANMLRLIGQLMGAIKDGRWSDVSSIGKQLLKQGGDNPDAMPGVTKSAQSTRNWILDNYLKANNALNGAYFKANDALNSVLPEWAGGNPAVKKPSPTKDGAALLGWMRPAMDKLEQLYKLPAGLLRSVAITESAGNPNAVSGAGAQGLFQIMPRTARDLGLKGNDAFDPMKSAEAAAKYLSQLLKANGGDLTKALASYNWGLGNVRKHGMALMPQETRNYVPRVLSNMPGAGATLNQETTINIHGVSDPREAGNLIADKQGVVNSRASQQMGRGNR